MVNPTSSADTRIQNGNKTERAVDRMSSEARAQADFATIAYNPASDRPACMHGHSYQQNLSDDRVAVYRDEKNQRTQIAYRGSVDAKDWLRSDAALAVGMPGVDSTFRRDTRQFGQLREAFKGDKFSVTGHSLGGSRAYEIARRSADVTGTTFNMGGALPGQNKSHLVDRVRCMFGNCRENIQQHHTTGDVVSLSNVATGGRRHNYSLRNEGESYDPVRAHGMDPYIRGSEYTDQFRFPTERAFSFRDFFS